MKESNAILDENDKEKNLVENEKGRETREREEGREREREID